MCFDLKTRFILFDLLLIAVLRSLQTRNENLWGDNPTSFEQANGKLKSQINPSQTFEAAFICLGIEDYKWRAESNCEVSLWLIGSDGVLYCLRGLFCSLNGSLILSNMSFLMQPKWKKCGEFIHHTYQSWFSSISVQITRK